MKKILSLILCLATIFSSVAFCVPAIAADIDFGIETVTEPSGTKEKTDRNKEELSLEETVTLTFVCDNLSTVIDSIQLAAGDTLDMTTVEDVMPIDSTKRFNGWSATGEWKDVLHGKVQINKSMTLYPVISYNFDFAVANNRGAWKTYNAIFLSDLYKNSVVISQNGSSNDVILFNSTVNIPAKDYKGINIIFDTTYDGDRAKKWAVGTEVEGLYFGRSGESASANRHVSGKIDEIDGYGLATAYIPASKHQLWTGTITYLRIDPFQSLESAAIRAIEFVPIDEFEETEINITGFPEPVTGSYVRPSWTSQTDIADVTSLQWSPALVNNRFDSNTVYTATLTLAPIQSTGKRFQPSTSVLLNGEPTNATYDESTGLITATRTFAQTGDYIDFSFNITGPQIAMISGKASRYYVEFTSDEEIPDKHILWTVDDSSVADMANINLSSGTTSGSLQPLKSGKIVITATSAYNYHYSQSMTVDVRYYDFTMSISGKNRISIDGKPVPYEAVFTSDNTLPDDSVIWSIESDGTEDPIAEITPDGMLTANHDGDITLRAVSVYNPDISATLDIHIDTPTEQGSITYHAGTTDTVTGLPDEQVCYGKVNLSTAIPTRTDSRYCFLGWALSDESVDVVDSIIVVPGQNVDVYAVWAKGVRWTYGTKGNHSLKGTTGYVGTGADYDEIKPKVGDYRICMPLNVSAKDYTTVSIRMSSTDTAATKFYYKTIFTNENGNEVTMGYDTNGFAYAEAQSVTRYVSYDGLDNFKTITFDILRDDTAATAGKWSTADKVVQIYVDPCKRAGQNFRLSSIFVCATPTVTFDKNTTDIVTGMPDPKKASFGGTLTVKETPVRDGYTLLGWSKTPDGSTPVKTTFSITGDITLYAIWAFCPPKFDNAVSFRTESPAGLRLRASVAQRLLSLDDNIEIGFLAALKKDLSDELSFENAKKENYPIVTGIGYSKTDGTETINKLNPEVDGLTSDLTAIVIGVPDNSHGYTSVFAFRPYVTVGNVHYYGDTKTMSLYQAAQKAKASADYEENAYIEQIIEVSENDFMRYLVVTPDEDGRWLESGSFDPVTGQKTTYVHAWVNGDIKWIKVKTDAKIWPQIRDTDESMAAYAGKLAVYSVDSDGYYTIRLLGNAYSDKSLSEDTYIGLNKDLSDLADENDSSLTCLIERDESEERDLLFRNADGTYTATGVSFALATDENTVFLIRNEHEDTDGNTVIDFIRLRAGVLSMGFVNTLKNVQAVVSNDPESTEKEKLIFYYAETSDRTELYEGVPAAGAPKHERIVKSAEFMRDSDKLYYLQYTLCNPYTGELETAKGLAKSKDITTYRSSYSIGDVIETIVTNVVTVDDEKNLRQGSVFSDTYWILNCDVESGKIEIVPTPQDAGEVERIEDGMAETFTLDLGKAAVSQIGNQTTYGMDMVRWGLFSKIEASALASDSNELKALNDMYMPQDSSEYKTVYAKYVKAYISIDWENENDRTVRNEKNNCNGTARFISVIRNNSEPIYRCELNKA